MPTSVATPHFNQVTQPSPSMHADAHAQGHTLFHPSATLTATTFQDVIMEKSPNMVPKVEIPTLKSSIKINDFPFFGLASQCNEKGQLVPLMVDQLISILKASPFGKDFFFYENSGPCLTRNSPHSDTGTLWFDINNSCVGLIMCNLVGRTFMYGTYCLTVALATKHAGVPQCNRCWRYGHLSNA